MSDILDGTTPGKWEVENNRVVSDDGHDICYLVIHAGLERLSDVPNGKLIAAAPDLAAENAALRAENKRLRGALVKAVADRESSDDLGTGHFDAVLLIAEAALKGESK